MTGLTTISYGGGVQSTAMIVLAATGALGYEVSDRRLSDAVAEAQTPLFTDGEFGDGQCDEGYCWT